MIRSALMVALTATTVAAQGFEGAITINMTNENSGQAQVMTYVVKGGKIRIDVPGGTGGAVIIDPAAKKMQMLMTAQKIYVDVDMNTIGGQATSAPPKITHTGKMDTVAGYKCEHVTVTAEDGDTDVCMAQGLGGFMMPAGGRGGSATPSAWVKALGEAGFPLKVEKAGKVSLEATKVEKKAIDASLFSVDGFTKMDMPGRRGGG
jgi:hypothetical protein